MDGDTSGGISPIAGIDKAFLRRWLAWLETDGPEGFGPIPALHAVNVQDPTAELRPPGNKQTDEADLMPYELLDAIERAAIRDKRSPMEVFQLMQVEFAPVLGGAIGWLGGTVLSTLVPQPVETGALCPVVPRGRRELGPENLVPLPDSFRRV